MMYALHSKSGYYDFEIEDYVEELNLHCLLPSYEIAILVSVQEDIIQVDIKEINGNTILYSIRKINENQYLH